MSIKKSLTLVLAATALSVAATAQAEPALNPDLDYDRVVENLPDLDEVFRREGIQQAMNQVYAVKPGMSAGEVRELLGVPVRVSGMNKSEWDYNFEVAFGQERRDYLVCQYKVVFDVQADEVTDTAWRRRQCKNLADELISN